MNPHIGETMQFRGRYYFLSNFYPSPIEIDGLRYESAEAAFQGQKNSQYAHMFTGSVTPLEAKRLGKHVPIDVGEWNACRLSVMRQVVRAKFEQNPKLQQLLLATTEPIVEDNNWGDTYWGKCRGIGSNHLGQILQEVRSRLIA